MEPTLKRLDFVLADEKYSSDIEKAGQIWTDLATLLVGELDQPQRQALDFAKAFWAGNIDEESRLFHLQRLCDRMDKFLQDGANDTRPAVINRIVASSLMTTTGLSQELGEFIVELAGKVGVDQFKLDKIFLERIPEYI